MKQFGIKNMRGVLTAVFEVDREDSIPFGTKGFFFRPPALVTIKNEFISPVYVYELKWNNQKDADELFDANLLLNNMHAAGITTQEQGNAYITALYKRSSKSTRRFDAKTFSKFKATQSWYLPKAYLWLLSTQPIDKSALPSVLQGILQPSEFHIRPILGIEDVAVS
jgi:hypothetical protein